ncbi:MAG: patatin-like phospholipase family protein [Culturomica sp.]|jgi:NTE family protein|nr:patatin-like phospholipase family protein [Culturomica sp.]
MRKYLLFLLFLFTFVSLHAVSSGREERKRIALVLSGGGAKGLAHVGVIKVLEEAGIPVDMVVGTSMGAIVGGLYAIGYNAHQLDSLVRMQNWSSLLGDRIQREQMSFFEREQSEKYVFTLPWNPNKERRGLTGLIEGQNVYNLLTDLTAGYHDSLDFSTLPLPFACVAANIVDGSEVVLRSGNLVQAMRASMAIPAAFTSVRIDSLVLVDGGIVNNFPVDVARAMGAEIVIGVDVQAELRKANELETLRGVMGQLISLLCLNKFEKNKAMTDIFIKPDINEYSAVSFKNNAIDTMINRGERAARASWGELIALKEQLGISEHRLPAKVPVACPDSFYIRKLTLKGVSERHAKWLKRMIRIPENRYVTKKEIQNAVASLYGTRSFSDVSYRLTGGPEYQLEITLNEGTPNRVNLGFRFDSEEVAAILLNSRIDLDMLSGSRFELTARLSKNPYIRVDYSLENPWLRKFNLSYLFKYTDFSMYHRGDKINTVNNRYHLGELSGADVLFKNLKFQYGLRYEYFDYDPFLYKAAYQSTDIHSEGFFSYFALAKLENLDRKYYPEKGISFEASYSLYTKDFLQFGGTPFAAVNGGFTGVISLTNRFKFQPSVYGRVLVGTGIPYPYLNYVGGSMPGRYVTHQLPFPGIAYAELMDNAFLAAGFQFRQRMGARHYLVFTGNYAMQDNNFFDMLGGQRIWGGGVGYSYVTSLGPIDARINLSDWSKKPEVYINLGFYF